MTETVSLEFLAKQMQRMLDRQGALEDRITVLTGMAIRHDGALNGLTVEVQGLVRLLARLSHRVDRLEETTP